jgi:hypothetical protein
MSRIGPDRVVAIRRDRVSIAGCPPRSTPCAWCGTWTAPTFTIGHRAPVFPGGPRKTTSPADFASLMNDLETKIFDRFDDDTIVHPGHGDDTTLGAERPHLAEWRKRGW